MGESKTEDQKVMQLANTLKSHGLAASMYEAIERARSILEIKPMKIDVQNEGNDAQDDATLNELMREVGVAPEQVEAQEKQMLESVKGGINNIKVDIEEAKSAPEKTLQIKEEIEKIKEEASNITEDVPESEAKKEPHEAKHDGLAEEEEEY